ncbi:MAG: hypothetical protein IAE82_16600 [Opitutaceae bacterium]|nr:hypothetical protein [Opitutaceae bacterium]
MQKLLRNPWLIAMIAIVLGVGTQAFVLMRMAHPPEPAVDPHAAPEPPKFVDWSFITPEIEAMRTELKDRLAALDARESELRDYELRLKAERAEIEKIKREVDRMRAAVENTITSVETVEQKNLKTLATTYSTMTPTAVLAIFREMDDDTVTKILSYMKPDPVGQILEEMARTKEGEGTLAGRAAVISNKLRLLHQVRAGTSSSP